MSSMCDTENYNVSPLSDRYPGLQPTTLTTVEVEAVVVVDVIDENGLTSSRVNVLVSDVTYEISISLINDMHSIRMTNANKFKSHQVSEPISTRMEQELHAVRANVSCVRDIQILLHCLAIPMFQQGEDLIEYINKVMEFMSIVASRFPSSNNQLRTSYNPRNQATIQDGKVTIQQVQGRQIQSYVGTGNRGSATTLRGTNAAIQPRVMKCYNCQGEGHIARQCTQQKRPRNTAWFKEKLMLPEAQEAGQILDEEQLAFLANPKIDEALVAQQTIPQNAAFQTEDLDAYDSNCDDLSSAKAVLMANLSSCDSYVLFEVPYSDAYPNDMLNQDVQEMTYSGQTHIVDSLDNEIHSDSNIIPHSQYLQETQDTSIQDTNSSAPNNLLILSLVIQMTDQVANLDKENQINKMLNKIKEDFGKLFVTNKELDVEQAFWLKHSNRTFITLVNSPIPVRIEAPRELPKVSLVNDSLKKLKRQHANFDKVVKNRTTYDAITAGTWGFEHTKACFQTKIIPFIKILKDTFNAFDKTLLDEITEVQTVFNQMEAAVDQCFVDKNDFEIQIKQLKIDNDQLLTKIMSQEIMHIAMNSVDFLDVKKFCVNECCKCLELETELLKKKDFIEKEINELKAQSQKKNTVIRKLKEMIKSLMEKEGVENVKKDIDEIETINIELDHSVAKLLSENENLRKEREHLKSNFKDQFDSIKQTRVRSKEHSDSLISQINTKSVKNSDLNAQLQEKVFAIAAMKNELRKLKGKDVVDNAVSKPIATTIAPGMFKINLEPLPLKLLNNRKAHMDYLKLSENKLLLS
ncbi:retrovirus-related pol polyprotein from transposon TNT 1-94 [Tanacetum coccineum]